MIGIIIVAMWHVVLQLRFFYAIGMLIHNIVNMLHVNIGSGINYEVALKPNLNSTHRVSIILMGTLTA